MRKAIKKSIMFVFDIYARIALLTFTAVLSTWGVLNAFALANNSIVGDSHYFVKIPYYPFSSVGAPALRLLEHAWPAMGIVFIISLLLSFFIFSFMEKYQPTTQKEIRNDG